MSKKLSYEELENTIIELQKANSVFHKALAALQESDHKFQYFFENAAVGMAIIDRSGKFLSINQAASKLLGYAQHDLLGTAFTDVTHPEDVEASNESFNACMEERTSYDIEKRYITKDNRIKWGRTIANPVFTPDDKFLYAIVHIEDTTKHRQREGALKQNEQRYITAQRIGHVGNWEYDLLTEKFWGSDEAKRIYGLDPESEHFTVDEVENCIPDRERIHQALIDLIEKGKPYEIEFEIRPITGSQKKIIKSIAEVVKNGSGKPQKVYGVIHDITNRKIADKNLRKSEKKYRHLFNSITDSILVADTDRNIIDCNQSFVEIFGYTLEEIIGEKTACLYDKVEEYQKMGNKILKHTNKTMFADILNYKKKSGEVFPGEINVFYLHDDKRKTVGYIGIIRDITYRRKVEESLQKTNEELKNKTVALEDTNTALKILLKKRDQDNQELEENIISNFELMITPFIKKLKNSATSQNQQNLLDIIEANLKEIVAPFSKNLSNPMMSLTASEIQIASMIKQGLSNKEIAQALTCSKRTIDTHRDNIRKKLKLRNKKINLRTFLLNS